MKIIRSIVALASVLLASPTFGQGTGQLPSGNLWGNPTAARALAQPTTPTALIDRALCSTRGAFLTRQSAGWLCLNPGATAGQILRSAGTGADVAYSTATYPATTTINQILFSSSANVIGAIATVNGGIVNANSSGVPSSTIAPVIGVPTVSTGTLGLAGGTSGTATITPQAAAGTPTLTLPNASGTFAVSATSPIAVSATTGNLTCATCVTSSGGGAISGTSPIAVSAAGVVSITSPLPLTNGGTNGSLTASNGGIFYSTASAGAILAATATANQHLASGASGAPAWTTATFPATTAAGTMLASSSANVIAATATPVLGANGGTGGQITFNGSTSGSSALRVAAAAGTSTVFQLPATNGSNTNVLQTDGSGNTSWVAISGTGTVTSITCNGGLTGGAITTSGTCAVDIASAANFEAGTANKMLDAAGVFTTETTTTYGTTTTLDFNTFINTRVTLTGNITTLTCSNMKASQSGTITFVQDGTGSRTMVAAWCSVFRWAAGARGVLTTTASGIDALFYTCISTSVCYVSLSKAQAN